MRFTILQLLGAVSALGAAIGVAAREGVSVACLLAALLALCVLCIARARKRWTTSNLPQKVYAATTATTSCLLLAFVIYSIGTSASLARFRNVRALQVLLAQEPRFAAVRVEYFESKATVVQVDGTVTTENDLQDLRRRLSQYDWRNMNGIYWDVAVTESKQSYHGWDAVLFGDPKPQKPPSEPLHVTATSQRPPWL